MNDVQPDGPLYWVDIHEARDLPETLVFDFVPKGLQQVRGAGGPSQRVPQYRLLTRGNGANLTFDWSRTPDDPGAARPELEHEAQQRVNTRAAWVGRVADLVAQVEQWGQELGWATRRIEKRLDDSRIGKHQVPALLMQEGTCRVLLEPVGRSAPGAEGIVDLYQMPAYDDIASLYFYGNRWHLHYPPPDAATTIPVREAAGVPLSKETLQQVLEEMTKHAVQP